MERARVVLVTNVGQGFGRAVALAYGRAGYHVVCADQDVDLASKTAAEVEELGGQAIPIQADMTTQMDVLTTFQKVLEIFGALGGVVHLASQVSTTAFENIAEGEFFDVMAENVRSSFLVLKTAARLLSVGWVVVVGPPTLSAVQMLTVQGALQQMVKGFTQRFSYPRVNLVQPSRVSADPRHDQALVRTVRYLGSHESVGVSGQIVDVELPEPPQLTESLLPEVRAALDTSVRQEEEYGYLWGASTSYTGDDDNTSYDDELGAETDDGEDGHDADEEFDALPEATFMANHMERLGPGRFRAAELLQSSETDAEDLEDELADEEDDELEDDYAAFDLHWSQELGLGSGPALRHVVGDDFDGLRLEESYAAGLEPAVDLYGDLTRLEAAEYNDFPSSESDDDFRATLEDAAESGPVGKRRR